MRLLSRWYANLSVRGKVLAPFVALFLVESLAAALIVGSSLQDTTYRTAHQNLRSLAAMTAQSLDNSAQALGQQASLISGQASLGALVRRDGARITRSVARVWWSKPPFLVEVLDRHGHCLANLCLIRSCSRLRPACSDCPPRSARGQIAACCPAAMTVPPTWWGWPPSRWPASPSAASWWSTASTMLFSIASNVRAGHELAVVSAKVWLPRRPGLDGKLWATAPLDCDER